jgi:hypothetical protein
MQKQYLITAVICIVFMYGMKYVTEWEINSLIKELNDSNSNVEISYNVSHILVYEVYGYNKNKDYVSFEVAENKSIPYYNCQNFSRDTIPYLLENYNISSHLMWGCKYENYTMCHNWISIDMEPQSGRLVNFNEEYPYRHNTSGEQNEK